VTTGVQVASLTGTIMIRKNRLYYCDIYCEYEDKYYLKIVLSLHDEEEIDYNTFCDYTYDGSLYDVVDVLVNNEIKTVLTTELTEIQEEQ
tara:strand:- start:1083 stop:1352 length:270 start_codon:yes stop_codon:yes gene_type:complete